MNIKDLSKEELIDTVIELKKEINKLKRKNKRKPIKTTKKQIIEYWEKIVDENDYSFDFSEADKVCWRCGYEKKIRKMSYYSR